MVEHAGTLLGQWPTMRIFLELVPTAAADDVCVEISAGGQVVHRSNLLQHLISLDFEMTDHAERTPQQILIKLDGKKNQHTCVNSHGIILSDVAVEVKKFEIENIDVRNIFCSGQRCYWHNYNGKSDWYTDEFSGYIGFNGTVSFDLYSPVYLWIGEQFA